MYHSDSDENIRRYRLGHASQEQHLNPRPSSTLSLNQLNFRRRSNPDIYPGTRRYSTSYSDEDILSNDQLDQIHFDPRYRDYRSASSLNNSNYRSRSNSLHSMASTGNIIMPQYQPFRRVSNQSPPLIAPLIPQKRWDTNPSIFIEEYCDNDDVHKSESLKSENNKNSKETLCTSNESLQPALSINDMKSFGDLTEIPFIDDDSNDSAPCRVLSNDEIAPKKELMNTCRKTVSFDMLKSGPSQQCLYSSASNGKNFPKNPHTKIDYTYMNSPQLFPIASKCTTNPCFHNSCSSMHQHHLHHCHKNNNINNMYSHHASRAMSNVRRSKDGYVIRSQSVPMSKFSSSSNDDHCTLIDKLIKIRMEEKHQKEREQNKQKKYQLENGHEKKLILQNYKIKWDEIDGNESHKVCSGKVKALTTYFNSLPFMSTECNCINIIHQSTPNLSVMFNSDNNKLSHDEMSIVRKQLKEWSEYGLRKSPKDKLVCTFMKDASSSPITCLENELYGDCKQYHEVLNRLDKIIMKRANHHSSLSNIKDNECLDIPHLPNCFVLKKSSHCQPKFKNIENLLVNGRAPFSYNFEKHKCRSPCYNIKRDSAKKCKKKSANSKSRTSSYEKLPQQNHQKQYDDNESLII
jgi:hypothetical protein